MNHSLRQKLLAGITALGTHISLNDPVITELIGNVGFDYLWIDTEHTAIGLECLQMHLIAARASGTAAIVRVPCVDPIRVKPILEMGPDGMVFPQVNSLREAEEAVASCLYPPRGRRGFGPRRAIRFGLTPLEAYRREAEEETLRLLQVENIRAVEDFEAIVRVEGVSAFILGPCDLAASMDHFGEIRHPAVLEAMRYVIARSHAQGIPVGVSYGACAYEDIEFWKSLGVNMISLAADTDHLLRGAQNYLADMRRCFAQP